MSTAGKIILKRGRDDSVKRFHPWIFSGAIHRIEGDVVEGDTVAVYSAEGAFLGRGHYQRGSIAVRLLTFCDEALDRDFFTRRISDAFTLRQRLGLPSTETSAYRLVHGEGDLLPGLIVDVYDAVAAVQAHSTGMYRQVGMLAEILQSVCGVAQVYNKSAQTAPIAGAKVVDGWLTGGVALPVVAREYGNVYEINPADGQKTGFFIDQRENRRWLQEYSCGANALNLFCYTGGFSVSALRGGAKSVVSVDSSAKAVALACKNVENNFGTTVNHTGVVDDVFNFLRQSGEKYDLIILDPPAFAKHHKDAANALQAYKRLNVRAMERLNDNGILFTFSCSQAIDKRQFREAVFSAAAITGRQVCILRQLAQSPDHPVNIFHPEGEYLKGLAVLVR
jgi:23S rRNA (cytosine1962-C5)-methyltransferase